MLRSSLIALAIALLISCDSGADTVLPTVNVVGTQISYLQNTIPIQVATRIPSTSLDTPRDVQTVTSTLFSDRGATDMFTALMGNVSGISLEPSSVDGNRSNLTCRSHTRDDDFGTKIDGQMHLEWVDTDLFNVDRIEIVKGPNAATGGLSDPGCFINVVTKQADWSRGLEVSQTAGLYEYTKTGIAFNTPINQYTASRTTLAYTDGQNPSLSGQSDKERLALSQNLMIKFSERTVLQFDIRHLMDNQNYGMNAFIPAVGSSVAPLNYRTNLRTPFDHMSVADTTVAYQLNSELNDWLSVHHDFSYQTLDRDKRFLNPVSLNEQTGDMAANFYWLKTNKVYTSTDNYFTVKQNVFGSHNTFVAGLNFINVDINTTNMSTSALARDTCTTTNALYCYNVYAPNFSTLNWVTGATARSYASQGSGGSRDDNGGAGTFNQNHFGVYAQDKLEVFNFVLQSGVRYHLTSQSGTNIGSPVNTAVTPNLGLVYKLLPNLSVYTDWSESFMPQSQSSLAYTPPQRAEQNEVGIKLIDPANRYSFTAAWYCLTKSNVKTADPLNPAWTTYVGKVSTTGYEVDGTYRLGEFTLMGNWALTNATVIQDTVAANVGHVFPSVPSQQFGSWVHWDTQVQGYASGAGIGFNHVGSRYGDSANSFQLPAYTTVDASAYVYPLPSLKISVNVRNLTDEHYYVGSGSRFNIMQGNPLTGFFTLDYKM